MDRAPREQYELASVGNHALLLGRAIGRHPWLFTFTWLAVVGASVGLVQSLPKTYDVQTTIQVSKAPLISALSTRSASRETDAPTRQAAETVLAHENLVALIRQTQLLARWPLHRAPLARLKDALRERFLPPPTEAEQVESFVGLLEKSLWVDTSEDTVSIGIHFPDRDLAFALVETAQHNFLEVRETAELAMITDAITILEGRAAQSAEDAAAALLHLQETRSSRYAASGRRSPLPFDASLLRPIDREGSRLATQLESKRRALADLEEDRHRRSTELESRLQEQRAALSDAHPAVQDTRQGIETLRQESPEVGILRRDISALEGELRTRGLLGDVPLRSSRIHTGAEQAMLASLDPREDLDPDIDYAKAELRRAVARHNAMLDRVDVARLELDSARAAFKYRYAVIKPPQKPKSPVKPDPTAVIGASIIAGLLLALVIPGLRELASRRFVEAWQVESELGIPVVGEVAER